LLAAPTFVAVVEGRRGAHDQQQQQGRCARGQQVQLGPSSVNDEEVALLAQQGAQVH
jgi:hypothetical protein